METKTRMVFLAAGLAVTLASAWGTASASPIYENHFDVYRTIKAVDATRSAKSRTVHVAKHRAASTPVVLSGTPVDKLPGTPTPE